MLDTMNVDNFIVKSNLNNKWKWKFKRQKTFTLPFYLAVPSENPLTIYSRSGRVLVEAYEDKVKIKTHYHFDGATCAPDFKRVLMAAALHDVLLQLKDRYPKKLEEADAHFAFKEEMKAQGFRLWPLYYWGVSGLPSRIYKLFKKKK